MGVRSGCVVPTTLKFKAKVNSKSSSEKRQAQRRGAELPASELLFCSTAFLFCRKWDEIDDSKRDWLVTETGVRSFRGLIKTGLRGTIM